MTDQENLVMAQEFIDFLLSVYIEDEHTLGEYIVCPSCGDVFLKKDIGASRNCNRCDYRYHFFTIRELLEPRECTSHHNVQICAFSRSFFMLIMAAIQKIIE